LKSYSQGEKRFRAFGRDAGREEGERREECRLRGRGVALIIRTAAVREEGGGQAVNEIGQVGVWLRGGGE
jgi:hypothetical protein